MEDELEDGGNGDNEGEDDEDDNKNGKEEEDNANADDYVKMMMIMIRAVRVWTTMMIPKSRTFEPTVTISKIT